MILDLRSRCNTHINNIIHAVLALVFVLGLPQEVFSNEGVNKQEANGGRDSLPEAEGAEATAPFTVFTWGSYGRVAVASDLRGGGRRPVQLIAYSPRILEGLYSELDLRVDHSGLPNNAEFSTQITLALGEDLFHESGNFSAVWAIRNLYLEGRELGLNGLSFWAGSRMLRGDDIYLLDFWPLDEQNTLGGGLGYSVGRTSMRTHIGMNRLDNPFQQNTIIVRSESVGTRHVLEMDRQRVIGTLRAEHHIPVGSDYGLKALLYAEGHGLPEGERHLHDNPYYIQPDEKEVLPSDWGYMLGSQLGIYKTQRPNHASLFLRYAKGLAATNELAVPVALNIEGRTTEAVEYLAAVSGNMEVGTPVAGLLVGAYVKYEEDASPNRYNVNDGLELGAALRPAYFVTNHLHLIAEANMQIRRPNGISPETGLHEVPMAIGFALMPALSLGRGSYSRPQLRIIYSTTILNEAARYTYAPEDPLRARRIRHHLGVGAEWWFNSSRN